MKKQWIVLCIAALAIPVLAQQTNDFQKGSPERKKHGHSKMTEQQRKERTEKKYKFLDKSLTRMGVGEEDRIRIRDLQIEHRKKMRANMQRMNKARKTLSKLEDSGADEAEIEQAIQEIANAQAEQLRILVGNRKEMENILGEEKYAAFMESARAQYRKHDNRSGAGIPPRPGLPPLPDSRRDPPPPVPPPSLEEYIQFMDHARMQFLQSHPPTNANVPPPLLEEYIQFMDHARMQFLTTRQPAGADIPPPLEEYIRFMDQARMQFLESRRSVDHPGAPPPSW